MACRVKLGRFVDVLLRKSREASPTEGGKGVDRSNGTRRDAQAPRRVGPLWIFEGRDALPVKFRGGRQHGAAMEAPTAQGMLARFLGW